MERSSSRIQSTSTMAATSQKGDVEKAFRKSSISLSSSPVGDAVDRECDSEAKLVFPDGGKVAWMAVLAGWVPRNKTIAIGPNQKQSMTAFLFNTLTSGTLSSIWYIMCSYITTASYVTSYGVYQDYYARSYLTSYPPSAIGYVITSNWLSW